MGDGRNAAAGGGAERGWASGAGAACAGALTGGGTASDLTRTMGCGGTGTAPRKADAVTTQAAVASACGSFNHAARDPVQSFQVHVRRSKIIIGTAPAPRGWRRDTLFGGPVGPVGRQKVQKLY